MSGSASLCCDVTQHASAPVMFSVLICMLTHVMSAPNVYTPCACHAAEQARICGYIFTLTSSSKWSLPNLCFPYLCQTLQAAFEKVKQEPPTEPGEGAGLYSCEHHQLSAIQVSLLLKGMLCVTLFFLLRLAPAPRPLTQSSPCWLCPSILLLATFSTIRAEFFSKTWPCSTAELCIHKSDHCHPTAGPQLTASPYPTQLP